MKNNQNIFKTIGLFLKQIVKKYFWMIVLIVCYVNISVVVFFSLLILLVRLHKKIKKMVHSKAKNGLLTFRNTNFFVFGNDLNKDRLFAKKLDKVPII